MSAGFAIGLLVGAVLMDVAWRYLRSLEQRLIKEQSELIKVQSAVIARHNAIFRDALRARAAGESA